MKKPFTWATEALTLCCAFGVATISAKPAEAALIPYGVQNDVSYNTVINDWGWTPIYRGGYGASVDISTLFNGSQKYLMLGAIRDGSSTIDVLGAALATDVQTYTPQNTTHVANGVGWYYNGASMGFAGPTDTIQQSSADINGSDWMGTPERDRMSWHTSGPNYFGGAPTSIHDGWRAGSNINIYDDSWDRVVFTSNTAEVAPVPELNTLTLVAIAMVSLMGVGLVRKKTQGTAAPVIFPSNIA